jgi:phosphate transport system protein
MLADHTRKAFDTDLKALIRAVSEMGGLAEKQISDSVLALATRNQRLAESVVQSDRRIDQAQFQIESDAIAAIAVRQPVAVDLRSIVAVLRAATEIERIGDLSKNIAKRVIALEGYKISPTPLIGLKSMATLAMQQLHSVLDALVLRDDAKASMVWESDHEIDAMNTSLFRETLTYVLEDPQTITFAVHFLFCAKNIERIGDHVTNIAEAVHYMVSGQPFLQERPKADQTSSLQPTF